MPSQGAEKGGNDHGNEQAETAAGDDVLKHDGHGSAGEGTHAHEAGVTQGQLTQDTDGQVQGDGHDDVGTDGHQHPPQSGGDGSHEDLDDDEGHDDQAVGQIVLAGGFVHIQLFHLFHLTLSHGSLCPADQPA